MKCRIDTGDTCRRCQRAGLPCIFVPRANASALMVPASFPLSGYQSPDVTRDILLRVKAIEDHLGLNLGSNDGTPSYLGQQEAKREDAVEPWHDDEPLDKLWEVSAVLERCSPGSPDAALWKRSTIRHLWKTCGHSSSHAFRLVSSRLVSFRFASPRFRCHPN